MSACAAVAFSAMVAVGGVSAQDRDPQPTDLTSSELANLCSVFSGDHLITMNQILLSHDAGGALVSRTLDTPIPAGTYDISALSFEERPDEIPMQAYEQWRVQFFSGSTLVFDSIPTIDIPETSETTTTNFGEVVLPSDVDRVEYIHYAFEQGLDATEPHQFHSVYAPCISFSEVEPAAVIPAACMVMLELDVDNPFKVIANVDLKDGDEVTAVYNFTWGDGSETLGVTDVMSMYTYSEAGTYTVTASVDGQANEVSCEHDVTIEETGAVLGVVDEPTTEEPAAEEETAEEPQVLGTSTEEPAVLAETGVFSSAMTVIVGTGVAIVALGLSQEQLIKKDRA